MFGQAVAAGRTSPVLLVEVVVPLQTPYRFRNGAGGNTGNTEWALVTYGSDYTIRVR